MNLRERQMDTSCIASPIFQETRTSDEFGEYIGSMIYVLGDGNEFTHMVLPYSVADFKRDPELRRQYNRDLVSAIKAIGADLVILDNFKLELDSSVVEEFKGCLKR